MSIYSLLFGHQPVAGLVLGSLDLLPTQIPRLRDAWVQWSDETKTTPVMVVLTRTGGGNREYYDRASHEASHDPETCKCKGPFNDDLRNHKGYLRDEDDPTDCTYAHFIFSVPDDLLLGVVAYLNKVGNPPSMQERLDAVIASIKKTKPGGVPR